jgi:hypothetical protein
MLVALLDSQVGSQAVEADGSLNGRIGLRGMLR